MIYMIIFGIAILIFWFVCACCVVGAKADREIEAIYNEEKINEHESSRDQGNT